MRNTKPFFQALETVLKNRLPPDEYAQVMEESLWELESEPLLEPTLRTSLARLASICVSFYRAMVKLGMPAESALSALGAAGRELNWNGFLPPPGVSCGLASFCKTKSAEGVCQTVFCRACPQKGRGCEFAGSPRDWSASGSTNEPRADQSAMEPKAGSAGAKPASFLCDNRNHGFPGSRP